MQGLIKVEKLKGFFMVKIGLATAFIVLLSLNSGCRDQTTVPAEPVAKAPTATPCADRWLGVWNGPEGTHLRLSKSGSGYAIEIQDLDGPKTFDGFAEGDRVRFLRDGKTEYISAGGGLATGMKWLAEKKDCLLTKPGEGWCRG